MKWAIRAAIGVALLGLAAPSVAQSGGYEGDKFVSAVRDGNNNEALDLLRTHPTVLNARNNKGETALYVAVAGRDIEWTGHLISLRADPNLATRSGETPLIAAARIGFADAAEWLIARKVKVDAANRMGETALIVAVQQRQTEIVRLLLDSGADPDKTDSAAGLSAREYAQRDTRARELIKLIEAKKPKSAKS